MARSYAWPGRANRHRQCARWRPAPPRPAQTPSAFHVMEEGDVEIELPVAPWEAALGAKGQGAHHRGFGRHDGPGGRTGRPGCACAPGNAAPRSGRGDQYVRLKLVNPSTLTESALFEQLAAASRFNPRELMKG